MLSTDIISVNSHAPTEEPDDAYGINIFASNATAPTRAAIHHHAFIAELFDATWNARRPKKTDFRRFGSFALIRPFRKNNYWKSTIRSYRFSLNFLSVVSLNYIGPHQK